MFAKFGVALKRNKDLLLQVGLTAGGCFLFTNYVVGFTIFIGPSMEPTIDKSGEIGFVDYFSYKVLGKSFERGDVVIAHANSGKSKFLCCYVV